MSQTDSRSLILERIRAANSAQPNTVPQVQRQAEWQSLPRDYRRVSTLNHNDLIALFDARIRHYHGTPFYSNGDIRAELSQILSMRGKSRIVVPLGFPDDWLPHGFEFVPDAQLSNAELNACEGVITTCTLGIALTGTVVLENAPGQGRRAATLVPDYHLCVLRRQDIVELVPEAIAKLEEIKSRPLTFFSGPSATVDIEMTRVGGVHGPRTLDILLT